MARVELFRPSRPDFIETGYDSLDISAITALFRPSRPDFIETRPSITFFLLLFSDCSGLLGRTSLRPNLPVGIVFIGIPIVPAF